MSTSDIDSNPTDRELLCAWQTGDAEAGDAYVERHFLPVYRFFATKCPDAADDLTQQTFADLHGAVANIRDPGRGRAYVMRIARNRLYMHLRSRASEGRVFDPRVMSISAVDDGPTAGTVLAGQMDVRALLQAMRAIPIDAQILLELFYWEELPVREIASILEVPRGTVMSRLSRARDRLAKLIGSDAAAVLSSPSLSPA